ncbi:hypothetical protein LBMAG52_24180 [Planctomycetia bacterium]|nr:hypothetical protein LBMAG52_24180 [Planctomycetia bacterium]
MKLLSGTILLLAAEQAFAHAQLVQFPNHEDATAVLIPASVVFVILGSILLIWGLLSEVRGQSKVDA